MLQDERMLHTDACWQGTLLSKQTKQNLWWDSGTLVLQWTGSDTWSCYCPLLPLSSLLQLLLQSGGELPAPGAPLDPQQLPQTPVPTVSLATPGNLSC